MTNRKDGGAAFPQLSVEACERDGHGDLIEPFTSSKDGMSLRDWFAGMALQGLLAHASGEDPRKAPELAYELADATLAEREKAGSDE